MADPSSSTAALIRDGRASEVEAQARAAVARDPADFGAGYRLFAALVAQGRAQDAAAELSQARLLQTLLILKEEGVDLARLHEDADYAVSVGAQLYGAGLVGLASVPLQKAVELGVEKPDVWITYGLALQHQGRVEESIAALRAAGDRWPRPAVRQFVLPALFPAEDGVRRHADEARAWVRTFIADWPPAAPRRRKPGEPIRIGYVAPNFTKNQARQFVTPILENHDPAVATVFCYAQLPDERKALPSHVRLRAIGALNDVAAAQLIREDRIDVLIDCWGHNAHNRLDVFARRPAPVQVSWLNYQQTTGLAAMDYVIQSDYAESDGMAELFTEEIWRMGDACAAFRPDPGPRTSPAPCLARGSVTFGAFIHPGKLTDTTVRLWAAILREAPSARLILKYQYYRDPVLKAVTWARFVAEGAEADQVEFRGRTSGAEYHAEFAEIDLALDPTPMIGGTTSLEALSRGVPVLTLKGETFYSRLGASVVEPAGLPDLVAESQEAYVAKAVALARDPQAMQALRERVPAGFDAAPYRDEAAITRRLEAVYRAMVERGRAAEAA